LNRQKPARTKAASPSRGAPLSGRAEEERPSCIRIAPLSVYAGDRLLVDQVELHLHGGRLTALVGPNGAGKTTLLRAILGQLPTRAGLTCLDHQGAPLAAPPRIGFVPQNLQIDPDLPLSVVELFAAYGCRHPIWVSLPGNYVRRVAARLDRVVAAHLLHRRAGSLSGGEWQRVLLALALENDPNLLLLDEPVSAMDANGRKAFYDTVSALCHGLGISVLLVSHDFDLVAQHADEIVLLDRRILARGNARQVYGSAPFKELFGPVWSDGLFGPRSA
jgi:zinc transport system ATP-binding protein